MGTVTATAEIRTRQGITSAEIELEGEQLTGPKGPPGDTGPAGPKGDTGAAGPAGPKGDTGATGAQGTQGIQGPAGSKGDTGATGPAGAQGTQGSKGDTGAAGPAGPAGPVNLESNAANIRMDGTASAGTSGNAARGDHVHPVANASVGSDAANTTTPWFKVATCSTLAASENHNLILHVYGAYSIGAGAVGSGAQRCGILKVGFRTGGTLTSDSRYSAIYWETLSGFNPDDFVLAYNVNASPAIAELWCRVPDQWDRLIFDLIGESKRTTRTIPGEVWTLSVNPAGAAAPTAGLTQIKSTALTLQNSVTEIIGGTW